MPFELRKHLSIYHSGLVYACKYCGIECRHQHVMKKHLERKHCDVREWQADPIAFVKGLIRAGGPSQVAVSEASGTPSSTLIDSNTGSYVIVESGSDAGGQGQKLDFPTETRFIITNQDGQTTLAQLPEGATLTTDDTEIGQVGENFQIDPGTMDSILAGFGTGSSGGGGVEGDHPYIVAEVQGLDESGDQGTTQTIIIQTDNGETLQVSSAEEVAVALQGIQQEDDADEAPAGTSQLTAAAEHASEGDHVTIIGDITQSDGQSVPIALQGSNVGEGGGYIIVPMKQPAAEQPRAVSLLNVSKPQPQ